MLFVIGGIASGKRTYVESLGFTAQDFDEGTLGSAPVLYGLEELLRQGSLSDADFDRVATKDVVVCCEVGSGIVPIERTERDWRDTVGRTCTQLAKRAEHVVRMVCGIPVVLK